MQHGRDSKNRTNQVVDADARIKNLTERRAMLTDKSAKLNDLVEVETQLANTQSELDSFISMRKVLSLETDLVAVNINFTAAQSFAEQGFFAPVARAHKRCRPCDDGKFWLSDYVCYARDSVVANWHSVVITN